MIPRETIARIMDAVRVDEVVGDFVSLKKRGINLIGLCPFHNEKTPSFTVSPTKGIFKCFGCGKAGNSVNFIMEHEHYSYPEALKYLAKKYQIDIQEEEQNEEEKQQQSEQESLFNLFGFAARFFSQSLWESAEGKAVALSYFEQRGFTHPIIRKFELGYCMNQREHFSNFASSQGYTSEQLIKAGLASGSGSVLYDVYRERVIFPIHNLTGRVIAFGARILGSDKSKPKYINTPETAIYSKSKVLYGLFHARTAIAKADSCYLVEGYTDVISMHQAGIENVVASSGTSLTTEQVRLIKRYTRNIVILYDGDAAGLKAAVRGIDMILEEGMNVKVVVFPEGEDPDSFVRNNRHADVLEYLRANARDFIAFRLLQLLEEAKNDPVKRVNVLKDFVQTISKIPDSLTRISYIKESAEKLNMPEEVVMNELNKILRRKTLKEQSLPEEAMPPEIIMPPQEVPAENLLTTLRLERNIAHILMMYGQREIDMNLWLELCERAENSLQGKRSIVTRKSKEAIDPLPNVVLAQYVLYELANDEIVFEDEVCKKIIAECVSAMKNNFVHPESWFLNHEDMEIRNLALEAGSSPYEISTQWKKRIGVGIPSPDDLKILSKLVFSSIIALKTRHIEIKRHEVQREIRSMQEKGEYEKLVYWLNREKDLQQHYTRLNLIIGRIITR